MKFAPLIRRWGADASSDKLRRCARCTECGHKGATLQHPGWVDSVTGFQPFPGDRGVQAVIPPGELPILQAES
jgi:hypothetical protein